MSRPVQFETRLQVWELRKGERHEVLTVDVEATWESQEQAVTEFTVTSEQGTHYAVPVWAVMSNLTDAVDLEEQRNRIVTIQQATTPEPAPFTVRDAFAIQQILEAVQGNKYVAFSTDGGVNIQEGTARRIGDQAGSNLPDTDVRNQFVWITTNTGMELFLPVRQVMSMVRDALFQPFQSQTPTR